MNTERPAGLEETRLQQEPRLDASARPAAGDGSAQPADFDPGLVARLDSALAELKERPAGRPALAVDDPGPLPARMLNEFVYCPRLFYYEHVEGLFAHNADTLGGAAIHKRVDTGSGAMPAAKRKGSGGGAAANGREEKTGEKDAAPEPETIHSRSVTLASDKLGVIAKLDLVESRRNPDDLFSPLEVEPVDYKAGSPRDDGAGPALWDTDRMQLGLQCLILRDNGYACGSGIIYYRGTRQRVRLDVTPELERWIEETILAARRTAAGNMIPPPLVDSPKCPRCSLATICLPDETRRLADGEPDGNAPPPAPEAGGGAAATDAARRPAPIRRLLAPRDDTRALYLNTPGLRVGRSGEVLQVKEKEKLVEEVRLHDLHHVALFGNIQISTQAVQILCERECPITYFSMGGWFYGITRGHGLKNVFTRKRQFAAADDSARCLEVARRFVAGKIRNQRVFLMRNHVEPPKPALARLRELAHHAAAATSIESLLGFEGAAAALYFENFSGLIKTAAPNADGLDLPDEPAPDGEPKGAGPAWNPAFDFTTRNRRPPRDPVNALLSLAYSLLAKDCAIAAAAVGFDPYIGFYHQPRFGRAALALDVMEEFRPLIADSAAITAINNRMIGPDDFVRAGAAVNLSPAGRRNFFMAYERRMGHLVTHPVFDYKVSLRRAVELQFRLLARWLDGEIPAYLPFTSR